MLERRSVVDLTRVVDESLEIYRERSYTDPPVEIATWCTVEEHGYWVSRLCLGTQTGTHIDAPAHFVSGGATLDALSPAHLMGRYFLVDVASAPVDVPIDVGSVESHLARYRDEPILLLCTTDVAVVDRAVVDRLCELPARVWAVVGSVVVQGAPPVEFHRAITARGKYLVEDLLPEPARSLPTSGELIALPLRLGQVSGAPCRVVALVPHDVENLGG